MRFYFKKDALKRRCTCVYWQELYSFILAQSTHVDGSDYAYISCCEDRKSCLLYEAIEEKRLYNCDFYVALNPKLKISKEDFYLSTVLVDEQEDKRKSVCLLPTGKSLDSYEKSDEIWIVLEENASILNKLLQREVCTIAKLHGTIKTFTAFDLERLDRIALSKALGHCKKLISFSKNIALNHWLCLLLGKDFILYYDDGSSPIRYAQTKLQHPFLREVKHSVYDDACFYKYDIGTSALRTLNRQLAQGESRECISWVPQDSLTFCVQQLQRSVPEETGVILSHLKAQYCILPLALPRWKEHKNSLSQLMDFVKKNPKEESLQQLLATYLLNFLPQEHWYKIEHILGAQESLLKVFRKTVAVLSDKFELSCVIDFAYGTYIRAIRDQQKYVCGWNQNLATCFDLCLEQHFEEIIELARPYIEKKALSGVKLTQALVMPLWAFKRDIPKALVKVCRDLIDLENTDSENIYGESIFYRALLFLLEGDKSALMKFLKQDFDPVKTQGYLGRLGTLLLKCDTGYTEVGEQLLTMEKMELLAKKPLALQTKAWGMLMMGHEEAYNACAELLSNNKTYFKQHNHFPEKWFIQSKIEKALGHKARSKRFRFLHNCVGIQPCIWERFE